MVNVISAIPAFTTDDALSVNAGVQEVKEPVDSPDIEEPIVEEKETPAEQPPAEIKPVEPKKLDQDTGDLERAVQGLQYERTSLLKEISELKGTRRELKQERLAKVTEQIDELKDVHPEDVAAVEKILRAKGYVTKEEQSKMFYNAVKDEKLNQFLEKYPEYKPENDPSDTRWRSLERELADYRMPDDPHKITGLLEKAHRAIAALATISGDRTLSAKKEQQIKLAGVGAGGAQRSSSIKSLDPDRRYMLERGGWSEEEIKKIEQNLK